jgi:hypothetical protein
MGLVITPTTAQSGAYAELLNTNHQPVPTLVQDIQSVLGWTNPVYVEKYLPAAGGDLKTAIILALAANPPPACWFILPAGVFQWPSNVAIDETTGLRNKLWFQGQGKGGGTEIVHDANFIPSGQIILFFSPTGTISDVIWTDTKFSHINCITGFASFVADFQTPTRCGFLNCWFFCLPDPTIVVGKGQWGAALLGGQDCFYINCLLTACEVALGSCINGIFENIQGEDANDVLLSLVGLSAGNSLINGQIKNVSCFGDRGSGVILAGSDGGVDPCGVVRNISIDGIMFAGTHVDAIPRAPVGITFFSGIVTESIQISHLATQMTDPINGGRGVLISSGAQTSWDGLVLDDLDLGIMATAANAVDAILISVNLLTGLRMSNIRCKDARGINIINVDHIIAEGIFLNNGTLQINADGRDLDSILINSCMLNNSVVLQAGLKFGSAAGHNFTNVRISDSLLTGLSFGLAVGLTGGAADLSLSDCTLSPAGGLNAETLAAVVNAANVRGYL